MRRAIIGVIVRRAGWTLVYLAGVFLLVAAIALAELKWEREARAREREHLEQNRQHPTQTQTR